MSTSLTMVLLLMVLISASVFIIHQVHLLMTLLGLEAIMLSTVILLPMLSSFILMSTNYVCVMLLTFGACEASLGLGLMVSMSRAYGSDLMKALTLMKC